tara:strand:+ start:7709 stop:8296 length:588 start_codon:yes stop_codon:yes gene_type:complete
MKFERYIINSINENITTTKSIANNSEIIKSLVLISKKCIEVIRSKGKIIIAGNGGSAADSQHIVAELVGRYKYFRPAIRAISITSDIANITAISNDIGYESVFERQLEAIADESDIFMALSTSGNSKNIVNALKYAKKKRITTIGFTGNRENEMNNLCDYSININSSETERIQECHKLIGHILCGIIEKELYPIK